jgi:hypothetical protein
VNGASVTLAGYALGALALILLLSRRTRPMRVYPAAAALGLLGTGWVLTGGWRVIPGACCLICAAAIIQGIIAGHRKHNGPPRKTGEGQ